MYKTLLIPFILVSVAQAQTSVSPAVVGLRKAFATAYQSCESLRVKPLTSDVPDVEGIEETGRYPKSLTGFYVKITDPAAVAKTHPYIREYRQAPGCVDVTEKQMIYDYGGKPHTGEGNLNYWKNSNGGSPGLGIDCSGFVFSSLAAGGLRLVSGKTLKAAEVHRYPAKMYIDPDKSGFTCLAPKSVGASGSLKPGDILASDFHVAMVESVGPDPLGLDSHYFCSDITYRDFDFVIAHSSPDKGNVGINKYEAKEYLGDVFKIIFRWGLELYARAACRAKRDGNDLTPKYAYFGISEPKTTKECRQPAIPLQGESCIKSCAEIYE